MRPLIASLLCFLPCVVWGQTDSTLVNEWTARPYSQEQKIGGILMLTGLDNPALTAFDRAPTVHDMVSFSNTAQRYDAYADHSATPCFWRVASLHEVAFPYKKNKNLGIGFADEFGRQLNTEYVRFRLNLSYRFIIRKKHHLMLGGGVSATFVSNPLARLTSGDQIDPRYGFIFPSQETSNMDAYWAMGYHVGLGYTVGRLFVSYAYGYQLDGMKAVINSEQVQYAHIHDMSAAYHFKCADMLTAIPMFRAVFDGFGWRYLPSLTVAWHDKWLVGVSGPYINRFQLNLGVQFWDRLRLTFHIAPFTDRKLYEANGLAQVGGSLRIIMK